MWKAATFGILCALPCLTHDRSWWALQGALIAPPELLRCNSPHAQVHTVGVGVAIGQACMLLAAGHKGKRFMLPHATGTRR